MEWTIGLIKHSLSFAFGNRPSFDMTLDPRAALIDYTPLPHPACSWGALAPVWLGLRRR